IASALLRCEVDVLTLGNHAWGKKEIYPYLDEESRILRPANYPPGAPGKGCQVYRFAGAQAAVIALQGRTFLDPIDDPFRAADAILQEIGDRAKIILVDFHAEATSEKQALGWYLDGRVSAVIGTHTHVQTADERILPKGTAYLTDVGMTGPRDSVIGMRPDVVLSRFTSLLPAKFEVAEGEAMVCGALIEVDESTGLARGIHRIQKGCESAAHRNG
ncbi:MAG TPA: TIGR00282 family metallophosphoesterase, partial [Chthonomonadales bacterium]|nr:TIGR00282 family metallophosphoesterase [Chthonomonadales bacterium]